MTSAAITFTPELIAQVAQALADLGVVQPTTDASLLTGTVSAARLPASAFGPPSIYVPSTGDVATDTQALMMAQSNLPATGGTIRLDAGPYRFAPDGVSLAKPVHLIGSGPSAASTTVLDSTFSGIGSRIECASPTGVAVAVNSDGCSFEKLSVVYTGPSTPTAGAGLQIATKGKSTRVVDCAFVGQWVPLEFVQGYEWMVDRCAILNPVKHGIKIQNTAIHDGGDGIISNSMIVSRAASGNPEAGIEWMSGGGLKVTGTKINCAATSKFGVGVHYNILDDVVTGITVLSGNSFENMDYGVLMVHKGPANSGVFKYGTFCGNEIVANVYGIAVVPSAAGKVSGINITGNVGQTNNGFMALRNVDRVDLGCNTVTGGPRLVNLGGVTNLTGG